MGINLVGWSNFLMLLACHGIKYTTPITKMEMKDNKVYITFVEKDKEYEKVFAMFMHEDTKEYDIATL